eukprot:5705527-Ditylum_brightwellii.AAC.1
MLGKCPCISWTKKECLSAAGSSAVKERSCMVDLHIAMHARQKGSMVPGNIFVSVARSFSMMKCPAICGACVPGVCGIIKSGCGVPLHFVTSLDVWVRAVVVSCRMDEDESCGVPVMV